MRRARRGFGSAASSTRTGSSTSSSATRPTTSTPRSRASERSVWMRSSPLIRSCGRSRSRCRRSACDRSEAPRRTLDPWAGVVRADAHGRHGRVARSRRRGPRRPRGAGARAQITRAQAQITRAPAPLGAHDAADASGRAAYRLWSAACSAGMCNARSLEVASRVAPRGERHSVDVSRAGSSDGASTSTRPNGPSEPDTQRSSSSQRLAAPAPERDRARPRPRTAAARRSRHVRARRRRRRVDDPAPISSGARSRRSSTA